MIVISLQPFWHAACECDSARGRQVVDPVAPKNLKWRNINEESFYAVVEGRGRPRPGGIWLALGSGFPGSHCWNEGFGECYQLILRFRSRQSDRGQLTTKSPL